MDGLDRYYVFVKFWRCQFRPVIAAGRQFSTARADGCPVCHAFLSFVRVFTWAGVQGFLTVRLQSLKTGFVISFLAQSQHNLLLRPPFTWFGREK